MNVIQWFRKTFLGEEEKVEPVQKVTVPVNSATITAPKVLIVKAPDTHIEGNLAVTGTITAHAPTSIKSTKKRATKKSKK